METIPDDVRCGTKEERIQWHSRRVRRERPAFDFLDSIDTGLLPETIRDRLALIRKWRAAVETKLALVENPKLQQLKEALDSVREEVRSHRAAVSRCLANKVNRPHEYERWIAEARLAEAAEVQAIARVKAAENALREACYALELSPRILLNEEA